MLTEKAKSVAGVQQWPYKAVAKALEVIPRTLIQNCGANTIRTLTALRVSTLSSQFCRIPVKTSGLALLKAFLDFHNLLQEFQGMSQKTLENSLFPSTPGKLLNFFSCIKKEMKLLS